MRAIEINACDLSQLTQDIFPEGKLLIKPKSFYDSVDANELRYFMYVHGIYVLPTSELIDFLAQNMVGVSIEIGCGNGAIGRALNIPITDSKLQEQPDIQLFYLINGQPVVKYPEDVVKMEAQEAIKYYRPDTCIGAYITHKYNGVSGNMYGVDEAQILRKIKKYIVIGNAQTHGDKPILKRKHESFYFDWLITRSVNQVLNRIWIFNT